MFTYMNPSCKSEREAQSGEVAQDHTAGKWQSQGLKPGHGPKHHEGCTVKGSLPDPTDVTTVPGSL